MTRLTTSIERAPAAPLRPMNTTRFVGCGSREAHRRRTRSARTRAGEDAANRIEGLRHRLEHVGARIHSLRVERHRADDGRTIRLVARRRDDRRMQDRERVARRRQSRMNTNASLPALPMMLRQMRESDLPYVV